MATLIEGLATILEEDLSPGVQDSLPELDGLFKMLFMSATATVTEGIGRSYDVIHTFREGVSGALRWVEPLGPDLTSGFTHVNYGTAVQVFPGLDEHASPGHVQKKVRLAKAMGNVICPHDWIRAGKLTAAITDGAMEIVRGNADNVALALINAWYAQDASGYIAKVAGVSFANNRGTNDRATVIVKAGSVRHFYPGMFVDVHNAANSAAINTGPVVVDGVRYVPDDANDTSGYGVVILQSAKAAAENLSTVGVSANDLIVRAGALNTATSTTRAPLGPEAWLIATGTVFNINVATYPQFQSIVKAVSGTLTSQVLNRYFGRFFQAYGLRDMPDTIVTSMGVTNAYVENSEGLQRFDRTGKPFIIADGYEYGDVPFVFQGRKMGWHVSAFMTSDSDVTAAAPTGGRMWGLKLRDKNVVQYVPPRLPQSKTQAPAPQIVEFAYPLVNSMFKPMHAPNTGGSNADAGKTTNFQEAPYYIHTAWCPKTMQGVKLTSLAESL